MDSRRGTTSDYPEHVDDTDSDFEEIPADQVRQFTATKAPPPYFGLDSEEECFKPLPSTEIPASAREGPKGKGKTGNPTVRPRQTIVLSDDDDEAVSALRNEPRAGHTNRRTGRTKDARVFPDALPARARLSGTPLPIRSPSIASARAPSGRRTASVIENELPAHSESEPSQVWTSVRSPENTNQLPTRNATPAFSRAGDAETLPSPLVGDDADMQSPPSLDQEPVNSITVPPLLLVQPESAKSPPRPSLVQSESTLPKTADAPSQRATPMHVQQNATSSTRVSFSNAGKRVPSKSAERSRIASSAHVSKPPKKPRMVKSAMSPPRARAPTQNHIQYSIGSPALNATSLGGRSSGRKASSTHNTSGSPSIDRELEDTVRSSRAHASNPGIGSQASATATPLPNEVPNYVNGDVPLASPEREPSNGLQDSTEVVEEPIFAAAETASAPVADSSDTVPPMQILGSSEHRTENDIAHNIDNHLKRCLDERYEDHAYFVKNAMWRQRTRFERELRAEARGDTSKKKYQLPEKYIQSVSPFAKMKGIEIPLNKAHSKDRFKEILQEIFLKAGSKDTVTRSNWLVPTVTYRMGGVRIPSFKEYVSLKNSILADNESKIMTLPYLGDANDKQAEEAQEALIQALPRVYAIRHDENALYDLRQEQCRFYKESVDDFLVDIGTTWDALLWWLLVPEQRLTQTIGHFRKFPNIDLVDRSAYESDEFVRDGSKKKATLFVRDSESCVGLLDQLRGLSVQEIRTASLACAKIFAHCKLSPWYMAAQCETMREYIKGKTSVAQLTQSFSFRSIVCRVCHTHNCLFHGQIRERPPQSDDKQKDAEKEDNDPKNADIVDDVLPENTLSDDESNLSQHSVSSANSETIAHVLDEDDSNIEKVINYRLAVNSEVLANDAVPEIDAAETAIPPPGPWKKSWWDKNTPTAKWEKRKPFIPCNHEGSCTEAKCRCFREGVTCEKSCRCSRSCNRRFPGCTCAFTPGRRLCGTDTCLCVKFNRECDADLCGLCGATEILDPVNRYDEDVLKDRCTNVGIQRGVPKKTLLGQSEVHGFGLYAGQDIAKNDIIGEYTGEIISIEESNRRGIVYQYQQNMYLFRLNKEQEVDATYMGNKLRFINNANPNLTNCDPKVLLCNTVFRVALYASTDIKAGTELFFNYNYPEETTKYFKQPSGNGKVFAVKQPAKTKPKKLTSRTSFYKPSDPSGSAARIEKPRTVKAAKRELMLAEKGVEALPGKRTPNFKQARKSAGDGLLHHRAPTQSASRSPSKATRSFDSPWEDTDSVSNLIVQDTDDDDDFVPHDMQESRHAASDADNDADAANLEFERQYGNIGMRRPSKPLARVRKSAPSSARLVAVRGVRERGGVRPGADRKRKQPLIVNSDDE